MADKEMYIQTNKQQQQKNEFVHILFTCVSRALPTELAQSLTGASLKLWSWPSGCTDPRAARPRQYRPQGFLQGELLRLPLHMQEPPRPLGSRSSVWVRKQLRPEVWGLGVMGGKGPQAFRGLKSKMFMFANKKNYSLKYHANCPRFSIARPTWFQQTNVP